MRFLALLAWAVSATLLAPVCFLAVIVLAGPHSSLLPAPLRPGVLGFGWAVFLVVPVLVARRSVGRQRLGPVRIEIREERELPSQIARLVGVGPAEGFTFVRRFVAEWEANRNRFDRPGEVSLFAYLEGALVGFGGLNLDPYQSQKGPPNLRNPPAYHSPGRSVLRAPRIRSSVGTKGDPRARPPAPTGALRPGHVICNHALALAPATDRPCNRLLPVGYAGDRPILAAREAARVIRSEKVNLAEKLGRFTERWSPRIVGELNGQHVKLAKLEGQFVWHHHDREDELFLVLRGHLSIHLTDRIVELDEGELFIVPRGVEHKPVAAGETHVLLLEPASTLNTGNVRNERTVEAPERL